MASYGGVPIMRKNNRREKAVRYTIITSSFMMLFLTFYGFTETGAPLQHYIKLFQTACTVVQVFSRLYVFFIKGKDIFTLRKNALRFWRIESLPAEQKSDYLWIYHLMNRILQTYMLLVLIIIPAFHIKAFFGYLPFYTWKPNESILEFWFVAVLTMIFVDAVVMAIVGFDCAYFAIIVKVAIQFHILSKKISEMEYSDASPKEITQKIDECANHHAFLLDFVKQIDNTFTPFFLAQYGVTAAGTIAYMAYFTLKKHLAFLEVLEIVLYVVIIFYSFSLICLPLAEITSQADLIRQSIFHSKWYDNDGLYKKKLLFMLRRCHNECYFTAGGLTIMNRTTLVTVTMTTLLRFPWISDWS